MSGSEALVAYQYVVLRCVPRVDREEFVNVGVVLYSQAADYLCSAGVVHEARIRAVCEETDVEAVRGAVSAVAAVCCGESPLSMAGLSSLGQRFGWLAAPKSTVVQPGPIHGGLTSDPARQLEHLVETLVH